LEPISKLTFDGRLAAMSALPVPADLMSAPLRFSKSPPSDQPERLSKRAL